MQHHGWQKYMPIMSNCRPLAKAWARFNSGWPINESGEIKPACDTAQAAVHTWADIKSYCAEQKDIINTLKLFDPPLSESAYNHAMAKLNQLETVADYYIDKSTLPPRLVLHMDHHCGQAGSARVDKMEVEGPPDSYMKSGKDKHKEHILPNLVGAQGSNVQKECKCTFKVILSPKERKRILKVAGMSPEQLIAEAISDLADSERRMLYYLKRNHSLYNDWEAMQLELAHYTAITSGAEGSSNGESLHGRRTVKKTTSRRTTKAFESGAQVSKCNNE